MMPSLEMKVMSSVKVASRHEVRQEPSLDIDLQASGRLMTLAQLAITIARREGLIGKTGDK
jgi:hypothetical protein